MTDFRGTAMAAKEYEDRLADVKRRNAELTAERDDARSAWKRLAAFANAERAFQESDQLGAASTSEEVDALYREYAKTFSALTKSDLAGPNAGPAAGGES